MKKIILLFIIVFISTLCFSQTYIDVLYLKNGSIIKGQILEQEPNKSLKLRTYDGSIYVYNMDQVDKIVKETIAERSKYQGNNFYGGSYNLRGYKGFIDIGYTFTTGDYSAFEISTSHGYQFNNHFFVGGGVALHGYEDIDYVGAPVYANFRANFINKKITPFGDFKLGYSAGDIDGVYVSIGVGARFALKNKKALNVNLAYSYQGNDLYTYYYYGGYYEDIRLEGIGIKFGFEF